MKRVLALAAGLALSLPLTLAAAAPATAAPAKGANCVAKGVTTLSSLGASQAAATGTLDYSQFADPVAGPIFLDLAEPTFLPLSAVIDLHRTDPQLFAWCA